MTDLWLSKLRSDPLPWLLSSNTWTRHMTLIDLLERPASSDEVIQAGKALRQDPQILALLEETVAWFPYLPKRHDDAKMSHYQLKMLADFGFSKNDSGIETIIARVHEHTENGAFAIRQTLPERAKRGEPDEGICEWHALPCDAPLISSTLYRLGLRSTALMKSIEIIRERWTDPKGWFCHLFFVESQFRKHQTPCMMAALEALELFSLLPDSEGDDCVRHAFQGLEFHREYGKSLYYFGRSKKFWTLKYPFVWYNALYVADVLSRFEIFRDEPLLKEIIEWIQDSQDGEGRFRPTSMFMHYRGWDFADKKLPSPWISFLCCRILKNYYS